MDKLCSDFLVAAEENEDVKFCLLDVTTGEWKDMCEHYTANTSGYWRDAAVDYVAWGTDGYAACIEYDSDDEACGICYNDNLSSGTTGQFTVVWMNIFRLIVTWTIQ